MPGEGPYSRWMNLDAETLAPSWYPYTAILERLRLKSYDSVLSLVLVEPHNRFSHLLSALQGVQQFHMCSSTSLQRLSAVYR